ncbi:hypothetical protein [Saccharothrix obliqua]|uniref:hypothetical protein n=1 Tax=Saccharothrix obliqua TaxID=2861747 RepID=UPI001C5ECA87|nr:hypothetical protein [Saccharothrix obliqua]MBW4718937.1 hypothetical protein [Saccharothrix obliqua]
MDLTPIESTAPAEVQAVARRLRECAHRAGYPSLRDLASAAGLSPSTVSEALSGGRTPSWKTVTALLKACDVAASPAWLRLCEEAKDAERRWRQNLPAEAATRPTPGMYSIRPPIGDLPARVRGRDALLDHLEGLLTAPPQAIQVLHGLGGCGKTTIALELARRAAERGHQVFWVSAHQHERLLVGMREIAQEIGVPEDELNETWGGGGSAPDLLWRYLDTSRTKWLLVIDNADEPGLLAADDGVPGDGTGWLRTSPAGTAVVTTRVDSPDVWGGRAQRHLVDVLPGEDAADVLIDLAGHAGAREDALRLADRLGCLPLALVSAGRYLDRAKHGANLLRRRTGRARITTFGDYRRELGTLGADFLDEGRQHAVDSTSLERLHRRLVGRTWEISLDLLEERDVGPARGLMRLISCFAPAPLPVDLIDPAGLDGDVPASEASRALEALVDFHLLNVTEIGDLAAVPADFPEPPLPCVTGHRLVLEVTASRVRGLDRARRRAVWRRAADVLGTATGPVPEERANWDWYRLVTPHVRAAVDGVPDDDRETLTRVLRAGLRCFAYLVFSRRFGESEEFSGPLYERSAVLDPDDPVRLAIRHRRTFSESDRTPEQTRAEYRDILDRQLAVLGPDDPDTLITWHNWATALDDAEGEEQLRAVVEARTRVLGPADPYTLLSRHAWSDALDALGREAEAEAEKRAIVADCLRLRGDVDYYTLVHRAYLASHMTAYGHEEAADAEYDAIAGSYGDGTFDGDGALSAFAHHQLAHALDKAGRYPEAEAEYRATLTAMRDEGYDDSNEFVHVRRWLGRNLRSQDRTEESLALFEEVIAECADRPATDPTLLALRHDYGDGLANAGRYAEAEAEQTAVLELRAGTRDSTTLQERHCRAHILQHLDRPEEAEAELREVADSLEELIGAEAELARRASWCHAMALLSLDRLVEALVRLERCLAAELTALGSESRDALVSRRHIAETRYRLGLADGAETTAELTAVLFALVFHDGEDGAQPTAVRRFLAELG